jgi:hypothetical protein
MKAHVATVTYLPTDNQFYVGSPEKLRSLDKNERMRTAIAASDVEAIKAKVILQTLLGLARPQRVLRGICKIIPVEKTEVSIDATSIATTEEKVPEFVEPKITFPKPDRIDFELYKNEVLLVRSDEARLTETSEARDSPNSRTFQIGNAALELARTENKQIAAIAEAATAISGADWDTSTNNPYDDIGSAMDAIEEENATHPTGFPVDYICANPRTWLGFFSNSHVKMTQDTYGIKPGAGDWIAEPQVPVEPYFAIPGLPGPIRGMSDRALTKTLAVVGSRQAPALVLADGPTTVEAFRNELVGYDAYLIRTWRDIEVRIADAIRVLTGVHA